MLLAICTAQEEIRDFKKKKKKKVTKNLLQGDSNSDPQKQLQVHASIHWTTSENSASSRLKEVYIPSTW